MIAFLHSLPSNGGRFFICHTYFCFRQSPISASLFTHFIWLTIRKRQTVSDLEAGIQVDMRLFSLSIVENCAIHSQIIGIRENTKG